jgi:hypothetical protein
MVSHTVIVPVSVFLRFSSGCFTWEMAKDILVLNLAVPCIEYWLRLRKRITAS